MIGHLLFNRNYLGISVLWCPGIAAGGSQRLCNAFWPLDRKDDNAMERAFCCLQGKALDFARAGRLWLNQGNWNGYQALPPYWMDTLLSPGAVPTGAYHCGFILCSSPCQSYMASGLMGQIIYVAPEKQLLILRFGHHKKEYAINFWKDMMQQMTDRL